MTFLPGVAVFAVVLASAPDSGAVAGFPTERSDHAMAYDESRHVTVLFGGSDETGTFLQDTWEWNGTRWANRTVANQPSPRAGHVMAYDSSKKHILLFGGYNADGELNDTWVWNGNEWSQELPRASPPPARLWKMVFDVAHERAVLVGVIDGNNETWVWHRSNWAPLADRNLGGGLVVVGQALTYDARARQVTFTVFDDGVPSWRLVGATWRREKSARQPSPSARANPAVAFDQARRRMVVFGGSLNGSQPNQETWEQLPDSWSKKNVSWAPPPRDSSVAVFDTDRSRVVLFGGNGEAHRLNDTWEYDGAAWAPKAP